MGTVAVAQAAGVAAAVEGKIIFYLIIFSQFTFVLVIFFCNFIVKKNI